MNGDDRAECEIGVPGIEGVDGDLQMIGEPKVVVQRGDHGAGLVAAAVSDDERLPIRKCLRDHRAQSNRKHLRAPERRDHDGHSRNRGGLHRASEPVRDLGAVERESMVVGCTVGVRAIDSIDHDR